MKFSRFLLPIILFIFSIAFINCGSNDDSDIDRCIGIECLNGGFCDDGTCICPDGFTGEFCEIKKEIDSLILQKIIVSHFWSNKDDWDIGRDLDSLPGPDIYIQINRVWNSGPIENMIYFETEQRYFNANDTSSYNFDFSGGLNLAPVDRGFLFGLRDYDGENRTPPPIFSGDRMDFISYEPLGMFLTDRNFPNRLDTNHNGFGLSLIFDYKFKDQ